MAKAAKVLCDRCESKIIAGVSFCDHCGCPTRWASHEERTKWEVSQWKTAGRSHAPRTPPKAEQGSRRWLPRPFVRKSIEQPVLTLVSAAAPKQSAPAVKPIAGPAITVEPSQVDGEALRDMPATVLAVRLLNARVAELDARIRQLEAELAERSLGAELLSK